MRQCILKIHKFFYGKNDINNYKNTNKFLWVICNIMFRLAEQTLMMYMAVYKRTNAMPEALPADGKFIVSLTTFPKRIGNVWMVVDSIFRQQARPRKICLYLTTEEFPDGRVSLPQQLLKYESLGLEICFREHNLMPHNKYFYALQEYVNECIVTVDDDLYYHDDTTANLLKIYNKYPHAICANAVIRITSDSDGLFNSYHQWKGMYSESAPSSSNCALGYRGVLYPPHCLDNSEAFNIQKIKALSLTADDLWLKMQEMQVGIGVACGDYLTAGIQIKGSQSISLMKTNCGEGMNNKQWKSLCKEYGLSNRLKKNVKE